MGISHPFMLIGSEQKYEFPKNLSNFSKGLAGTEFPITISVASRSSFKTLLKTDLKFLSHKNAPKVI